LERTLAVAWESGATPVVVLTKPDRCPDVGDAVAAVRAVAMAVDVEVVNGLTGEGVEGVRRHLSGNRTAVLIGPSGAGKSTLTNLLAGEPALGTNEVRAGDRKGRHTTTARHLVVLAGPGGGVLIDTPGLRALAVWDVADGVAAAFADVDELAAGCRFRDCRHDAEPGCAVRGHVDSDRLRNWRHLSEGVDPVEARRRAKVMQKSYRRMTKGAP
ncbi:MAG: ribosome small subunit-dependent GTPase A, partial [Acidimicrobiales bacterium]